MCQIFDASQGRTLQIFDVLRQLFDGLAHLISTKYLAICAKYLMRPKGGSLAQGRTLQIFDAFRQIFGGPAPLIFR